MTKKDDKKDTDERDEDEQDSDEREDEDEDGSDEESDDEESDEEDSDEEDSDDEDDDDEDDEDDDEEEDDDSEEAEDAETVPRKAAPPAKDVAPAKAPAKAAAKAEAKDEDDEEDDDEEDDDDEDDEDDEDDDDEDEAPAASARPVARTVDQRAERARRRRELEHGGHDAAEPLDGEDPSWWTPHAVLGALVLFGVLGFFGVFNKLLGGIAARPAGAGDEHAAVAEPAKPATSTATPTPRDRPNADAPKEMFGAKHLLVMYKGGRRAPANIERTKDEAKARATEAMKKAKGGAKFEDLVKEYSDEPNAAQRGGDLGQFPKGSMVPEFQAGLEKIKVGEISDVVETPFGFHVIQRTK